MNSIAIASSPLDRVEVYRLELRTLGDRSSSPYEADQTPDLLALSTLLKEAHINPAAHPAPQMQTWWSALGEPVEYYARYPDHQEPGMPEQDVDEVGEPESALGFISLEQYRAWFSAELREMISSCGFELVTYHAPAASVRFSSSQAEFDITLGSTFKVNSAL